MRTKIIYCLISSNDDYYVEQALVSIYSLKKHNPGAHIVLMTDEPTDKSLSGDRARIKSYIDESIIIDTPSGLSPTQRSRFIKTSVRQNISGDFLYVDNDTIICDSLEEFDSIDCSVGAVLDYHSKLDERQNYMKSNIDAYLSTTKKKFWNSNKYFNSGIIFAKDNSDALKLYKLWHKIWNEERVKYKINIDQPSFAQSNAINNFVIKELSGNYNCQILVPNSAKYFLNPKIVHYYASSKLSFPLNDKKILKKIRENGITQDIEYIVNNPQIVFLENSHFINPEDFAIINSPMGLLGRKLSRDFKWTNTVARVIYNIFGLKI